jgi:hypothetical protein
MFGVIVSAAKVIRTSSFHQIFLAEFQDVVQNVPLDATNCNPA